MKDMRWDEVGEAMESAANYDEKHPQWIRAFMSPAGWEHYHQLRKEADPADETNSEIPEQAPRIQGIAGLYSSDNANPVGHTHTSQKSRQ